MHLTIVHDGGSFPIEVDESMELGNLHALLELECEIPVARQVLLLNGRRLGGANESLSALGLKSNDALYIHDLQRHQPQSQPPAGATDPQLEAHRRQVLGNPQLMQQLAQTHPEIAEAARSNPQEFGRLVAQLRGQQQESARQQQMEMERLNADPYNVEAQQRIEEMIRQENIMRNMELALEHNPESFASVSMLYIDVVVNNTPIQAMVDSGAQATVMSLSCAERCGIMRLVDSRFAGEARGVGRAKILGRVHNAQMKLGDQILMCSFTVMEGAHINLLFGLDMLKRHQMCIDLKQNALVIGDKCIEFLPEHLIPRSEMDALVAADPPAGAQAPVAAPPAADAVQQQLPRQRATYAENVIEAVMALGVDREQAIHYLDAAGGNPDVAAGMLFS
ncbi:DNA damage-inducible protein 1 [Coemansia biformis]|uniref:DNA damage-inducible protein 1 n=1 Tax=Coemansia biformis TaxID=1286918 RepID=A0A9W7Y7C4_9FUNG|nr:DNA damage-inducible protein 1 [Coemansia biformis]